MDFLYPDSPATPEEIFRASVVLAPGALVTPTRQRNSYLPPPNRLRFRPVSVAAGTFFAFFFFRCNKRRTSGAPATGGY